MYVLSNEMVSFKVLVTSLMVKMLGFVVGLSFGKIELEKWRFWSSSTGHASRGSWHATLLR